MTGYDAFLIYQGVKLHFNGESYDYFKYNKTYRCKVETFENRKDRFSFQQLSRKFGTKEELEYFISCVVLSHPNTWVGELNGDAMNEIYLKRRKIKESLEYETVSDLERVGIKTLEDLKRSLQIDEEDGYPPLFRHLMRCEINPETLIAIDVLTGCLEIWTNKIHDTIVFPKWKMRLERYLPFMTIDKKSLATRVLGYLQQPK